MLHILSRMSKPSMLTVRIFIDTNSWYRIQIVWAGGPSLAVTGHWRLTKSRGTCWFYVIHKVNRRFWAVTKSQPKIWDFRPKLKQIHRIEKICNMFREKTQSIARDFLQKSTVTFKKSGSDRTRNYLPLGWSSCEYQPKQYRSIKKEPAP